MLLRWKKSLLLSTAVAARWGAVILAILAERARRKADRLLPVIAMCLVFLAAGIFRTTVVAAMITPFAAPLLILRGMTAP